MRRRLRERKTARLDDAVRRLEPACSLEPNISGKSKLLVFLPRLREDFQKGDINLSGRPASVNKSVVVQFEHVQSRLAELELTEGVLREALTLAHSFAARCTLNHPRIYPGLVMWAETIKALRDLLRPEGWHSQDEGTYDRVIRSDRAMAIAVASGNEAVGISDMDPTNKSPKGRNTVAAVEANRQLELFPIPVVESEEPDDKDGETWILLHFYDASKGERRAELSRPRDIDDDGRISAWYERIILTPLSIAGDFAEIAPPDQPDVDFDIERKNL
jgi:hypothetical protein